MVTPKKNHFRHFACLALACCVVALDSRAAILENQVLVVVNTNSADSIAIGSFYTNLHPAARTVAIGTTTANSILRTNFISQIRDPVRSYLSATPGLATQIVSIVTTRGIPYILSDSAGSGGNFDKFNQGLASIASLDADLALLWQNIVAGNSFSNAYPAHNVILNPYFGVLTNIALFSRVNIQTQKTWSALVSSGGSLVFESPATPFTGNNAFGFSTKNTEPTARRLLPGDMYLVTRLSGYSVTDVTNSLMRSQNVVLGKDIDVVVLDGDLNNYDGTGLRGVLVYNLASNVVGSAGYQVLFDRTGVGITNLPSGQRILSYSSFGVNGANTSPLFNNAQYINNTLHFNYAPGAVFNTYESYNGSDFDNPNHGNQGMVADFIRQGGSLGFGHVNEPFTFAVANEDYYLADLLLNGLTWGEAAYAGLPLLSWENVVIGDPLTKFTFVASNAPPAVATRPATNHVGQIAIGSTGSVGFIVQNVGNGTLGGTATVQTVGPFTVGSGSPFALIVGNTTNVAISFAPAAPGTFTNRIIFTSNGGSATNVVFGTGVLPPLANFTGAPTNGVAPLAVTFTDTSTGSITNRLWNFGDGSTLTTTSTNVVHTYQLDRTNNVTLIVQGPFGTSTNTKPSYIAVRIYPPGDVNGDVRVTGGDPLLINQVIVNLRTTNDAIFQKTGFLNGDVNQTGTVTGGDPLLINQVIVGLRSYIVTKIVPPSRSNSVVTAVSIYGIGFPTNGVTGATIGAPVNLTLSNLVVVSPERLDAIVPTGGGLGTGTVSVIAFPSNSVTSFGRFINK